MADYAHYAHYLHYYAGICFFIKRAIMLENYAGIRRRTQRRRRQHIYTKKTLLFLYNIVLFS